MSEQDQQQIVSIEPHEEIVLAAIQCARMDEAGTGAMQEQVGAAAEASRHLPVVLDMSNVQFFPSLSLGALVNLLRDFKQHNQRFMLVGVQPPVRSALSVTRLDKLFEIYDSVDDALRQLREAP